MNEDQIAQMTVASVGLPDGLVFGAADLHEREHWNAMPTGERVARGRWLSGAVARGELPHVEFDGKDVHNHRKYVRLRRR